MVMMQVVKGFVTFDETVEVGDFMENGGEKVVFAVSVGVGGSIVGKF